MRKYLLFLLKVAFVLLVLRFLWAGDWFNYAATEIKSFYTRVVGTPEFRMLKELRQDFLHKNFALQDYQVDYVLEVTRSVEDLKKFHMRFCVEKQINPIIYGNQLNKFCTLINQTELLQKK